MKSLSHNIDPVEVTPSQPGGGVSLVQFSDLHLHDNPAETLLGVNTDVSFSAVVQLAKHNHWSPDLVLVTGDMVHSGSVAGYRKLLRQLQQLRSDTFCLPGNHDMPSNMHQVLNAGKVSTKRVITAGAWTIVMLDSTVPGQEGGALSLDEIQLLDKVLQQHRDSYVLVALHHPPNSVGCTWLDSMALANPEDLFEVIDRHRHVRCVLNGHVHQHHQVIRNNVMYLSSPSTCVQFKPQCDQFAVDTRTPGYRWMRLQANGSIRTGINRLDQLPADIDIAASGY